MTRVMRQNNGVISLRGLCRLGFTRHEVAGLIAHGDLRRLHRGVYADGRAPLKDIAYFKAALIALGPSAWLSGRTAAMVWGLTPPSVASIDVTVFASSTPKHPGLRVGRVSRPPHPSEVRTRNGLRVSSIPRLLIETAAHHATTEEPDRLIDAAVGKGLLDIPELAATIKRNTGTPGTGLLSRVCEEYLPHKDRKSGLERSFDRWLHKHPEIPQPQRNIYLGQWEIDCYWPEHNLALELDGRPYHTVIKDIERDHRKNTWLQLHNTHVLRITDSRWKHDKHGAHRDLVAMLALQSGGERMPASGEPTPASGERTPASGERTPTSRGATGPRDAGRAAA